MQGLHCYLQPFNYGTEPYLISMGDNVHVASGVTFVNHDIISSMLNYMFPDRKSIPGKKGKIIIGDNVFIGANSLILYDVHIGDNVIIGAGSVVVNDIPSNSVAVGCPCKVVDDFDSFYQKRLEKV